jgi:hypothetical protein
MDRLTPGLVSNIETAEENQSEPEMLMRIEKEAKFLTEAVSNPSPSSTAC